ncbi:hypothetical protein [Corynebacterium durum]|uniref:hypothetical protein n=1 Tax=Corynebacterium durum TaxID=61592 RepID=UPI0026DD41CD|nr:hypothetical protein [Corynebacterium durum]MDO4652629.1 hypothetical protein [Corynebacterium durum]
MDSQQLVWRGNTLLDAATAAAGAQGCGGDSGVGDVGVDGVGAGDAGVGEAGAGGSGAQLAHVLSDVIYIGDEESLLIERLTRTVRFRCRGTTSGGEVFTFTQPGFTVSTLVGDCAGRSYELRRVSPWRKGRAIMRGDVEVGVVEAGTRELVVYLYSAVDGEGVPLIDVVFLTWCCVLVDMPQREMRG